MTDNADKRPIARGMRINYNKPIAWLFWGAYSSESYFYHILFFLLVIMQQNNIYVNSDIAKL